MRRILIAHCGIWIALLYAVVSVSAQNAEDASQASGQTSQDQQTASNTAYSPHAVAVTGQAFSALRYSRKVAVLPDGELKVVEEVNVMAVARDGDGRVRIEFAGADVPECANLGLKAMEKCPVRTISVFDPMAQTMTHWGGGAWTGPGIVVIHMSAAQVDDAERLTLTLPGDTFDRDGAESDGAVVTTKKLEEKQVEGIRATGVRTTVVIPAGHAGNKEPITTIHEVWVSTEMQLVVKVIDGDPAKELRISGLEHVSLSADGALFLGHEGDRVFSWTDHPEFASEDLEHLALWFPQSAEKDEP